MPQPSHSLLPLRVIRTTACAPAPSRVLCPGCPSATSVRVCRLQLWHPGCSARSGPAFASERSQRNRMRCRAWRLLVLHAQTLSPARPASSSLRVCRKSQWVGGTSLRTTPQIPSVTPQSNPSLSIQNCAKRHRRRGRADTPRAARLGAALPLSARWAPVTGRPSSCSARGAWASRACRSTRECSPCHGEMAVVPK